MQSSYLNLKNITISVVTTTIITLSAYYIASAIIYTDFPVYYKAAKIATSSHYTMADLYDESLYRTETGKEKNIPGNQFLYSPIIALIISPLGYLPYLTAKCILIIVDLCAICSAVVLLLLMVDKCSLSNILFSIISTFIPLFYNIYLAQVNGFILLLIAVSIYLARRRENIISGSLLGFAALFKVFPLGIAFLLGFINRKIIAACLIIFTISILIPGGVQWIKSMPTVSAGHTPVYLFIEKYGRQWQILYSFIIFAITFFCVFKSKHKNIFIIAAYSVSATLVAMPVVQYHYLIILQVVYIFIFNYRLIPAVAFFRNALLILTALHINLALFVFYLPNIYWSVFVLWIFTSWTVLNEKFVSAGELNGSDPLVT